MDYIYGFNSSQYLYFLTVQKKSYLPGKYLSIDQSETRILSLDNTYGLSGIRMKSCDSMLEHDSKILEHDKLEKVKAILNIYTKE